MLIGFVGVIITSLCMGHSYRTVSEASTTSLAESISGTLLPAVIGSLFVFIGLVLALIGLFRRWRKARPMEVSQA